MKMSPKARKLLAKEQRRAKAKKRQAAGAPKKPLMLNLKERIDKGKGKGSAKNVTPPKPAPLLKDQNKPKQLSQREQKPADVPAKGKEPGGAPKKAPLVDEQQAPKQLSNKKEPMLRKPKKSVIASLREKAAKARAEDQIPF